MRNFILLLLAAVVPALAELPEFYRHVDRVIWVVDDVDRTIAGWQKLGMIQARANRMGADDSFRWSVARLGNLIVDFIQPLNEQSPFGEFRKHHGQGVFALAHRVHSEALMDQEIARLKALGVGVIADRPANGGTARCVLFDTEAQGKYFLALIYAPPGEYTGALAAPPAKPNAKRVSQYAFVVRDMPAVSRYWAHLGLPEMSFTHPKLWDLLYHGKPGDFDANLGWQKHGDVQYEWIQPTKGPTTYVDHMARYGEGIHHIAFAVSDIDREEAAWSKAGFPTSQSGAWGDRDQPGYGRYAYQDTHAIGGTEVELLWNYRKSVSPVRE